ncbi:MAG TPA: hypothetical protein VLU96_00285 [Gaiellaceae bacterium]|nr:hypothetical protein [Gaiellaceae bacterium]
MSTTPPEEPGGSSSQPTTTGSITSLGISSGATLPMPGNAEFLLLLVVEIIFTIIWIAADSVNTFWWCIFTVILTAFYFLSRGIAKASRVLEQ